MKKAAPVTGTGRGMGAATAVVLAKHGYDVGGQLLSVGQLVQMGV